MLVPRSLSCFLQFLRLPHWQLFCLCPSWLRALPPCPQPTAAGVRLACWSLRATVLSSFLWLTLKSHPKTKKPPKPCVYNIAANRIRPSCFCLHHPCSTRRRRALRSRSVCNPLRSLHPLANARSGLLIPL